MKEKLGHIVGPDLHQSRFCALNSGENSVLGLWVSAPSPPVFDRWFTHRETKEIM